MFLINLNQKYFSINHVICVIKSAELEIIVRNSGTPREEVGTPPKMSSLHFFP